MCVCFYTLRLHFGGYTSFKGLRSYRKIMSRIFYRSFLPLEGAACDVTLCSTKTKVCSCSVVAPWSPELNGLKMWFSLQTDFDRRPSCTWSSQAWLLLKARNSLSNKSTKCITDSDKLNLEWLFGFRFDAIFANDPTTLKILFYFKRV